MLVYVLVDPVTYEVLSISKVTGHGVNEDDVVTFQEYNKDGQLVLDYETTYGKVKSGEANFLEGLDYSTQVDRGSKWFQFACNFSTAVACSVGCVAFSGPAAAFCSIACATFAGTFACG
ncbi:hypothetical protein [Cytobacillus kochii]